MANNLFEKELHTGEKILWSGKPAPGGLFNKSDLFMVPFSLLWGGFALFWEGSVLGFGGVSKGSQAPFFFVLWGIPFVLVGIYFIFGRFIYKAYRRRHSHYAVTDRRVLATFSDSGSHVDSVHLFNIPSISKTRKSGGLGNLVFGSPKFGGSMYLDSGMEFMAGQMLGGVLCFSNIPEVDRVHRIVETAAEDLRTRIQKESDTSF